MLFNPYTRQVLTCLQNVCLKRRRLAEAGTEALARVHASASDVLTELLKVDHQVSS